MSPDKYRKMIKKIHISEKKRKETAELLKQNKNEADPLPVNKIKTKWLSSPYIRRYVAVAACAAIVLTGILIGIPKKNIPTAENNNGKTDEFSGLTDTTDSASEETAESSSDGTLSADSPSSQDSASPADTAPTSVAQPTAALQKYDLSVEPTLPKALSFYDSAARANLLADNPLDPSFINAVQQFSWRSSSKLMAGQSGNVTYSPASVYMALAMAGTGAGGHTKQEFLSVLGVNDMGFLSKQCGNLFRRSYISNEIGTMKMADSLWLSQYDEFQNSYVQNTVKNFYASIYNVDFNGDAGGKISSWISKNTNGILKPKIKTVPNEMMSIVNTIYFKDQWVYKFDPSSTYKGTFTMENGQNKTWDFMSGKVPAKSYTGDGFKGIALEMKNVGSMVFVLPDTGIKAEDLLSSPEKTASLFDISKGRPDDVYLSIPKFSMGNSEIQLKDMLMSLGLKSAFDSSADFSGISKTPSYIDHVQHGAHVQIDENGAEAAAYTEIGTKAGASCPMLFNRPFIYAVLSNDGIPLFIGVCEEPVYQ